MQKWGEGLIFKIRGCCRNDRSPSAQTFSEGQNKMIQLTYCSFCPPPLPSKTFFFLELWEDRFVLTPCYFTLAFKRVSGWSQLSQQPCVVRTGLGAWTEIRTSLCFFVSLFCVAFFSFLLSPGVRGCRVGGLVILHLQECPPCMHHDPIIVCELVLIIFVPISCQ